MSYGSEISDSRIIKGYGTVKSIFDFPHLIIDQIFSYLTYEELSKIRMVSRDYNNYAQNELNKGFEKLGTIIENCKSVVKKELPKRESMRKKHRLTKINDIYSALDTRYSLLDLTFKKFMRHTHPRLSICFIPGKVLDEFHRVLDIMKRCHVSGGEFTGDSTELLKELRDLSSMAMEYYEEYILPPLEALAEREGVSSCMFASFDVPSNKRRKLRGMFRNPHEAGGQNMPFDILAAGSPAAKEFPKTIQDKIDEQQKKIDSQQVEIRMLRDGMSGVLNFLKIALPKQKRRMHRMLGHIPALWKIEEDSSKLPSTSTNESRKRKLSENLEGDGTKREKIDYL